MKADMKKRTKLLNLTNQPEHRIQSVISFLKFKIYHQYST